jgi:hypothetical protein
MSTNPPLPSDISELLRQINDNTSNTVGGLERLNTEFTSIFTSSFNGLSSGLDDILSELKRIREDLQNATDAASMISPAALGGENIGNKPTPIPQGSGGTPGETPPVPNTPSLSSRMSGFFNNTGLSNMAGRGAGFVAGGIATGAGMLNAGMAASQASMPIRGLGYSAGGAPTAQMGFMQQMASNVLMNPAVGAAVQGLGLTSAYNSFLNMIGIGTSTAAQQAGLGVYGSQLLASISSGGNLPQPMAVAAVQAAQQAGYSYGGLTGEQVQAGAWKKTLFGQLVTSENQITQVTGGILNPSNITTLLDDMLKKFGQSFDITTKSVLGFNTAAQASQKSLEQYSAEITQAVENLQQAGLAAPGQATEAMTAARTYASLPQISAAGLQKIINSSGAMMLAANPGKFNQNDFISMMTGNTTAMAGKDANQAPFLAAQAANTMVNQLMKSGVNRQAAIQEYAFMTGTSAGDITNLINPNNMKTLQQQATLGTLEDQLSSRSGEKGTSGAKDFQQYMKDFNAAYGISSAKDRKQEAAISSRIQQGKETLSAGIADLKKLNPSGDKANTNPILGTIMVEAAPGTKATLKAGSNSSVDAKNNRITVKGGK